MIHSERFNAIERRAFKRWQLIFYLRVFNQDSNELLGHIIDISESGMMLISDDPIAVPQGFRVWVDVPNGETHSRQRIQLETRSLWSGNDINPDFYDTGFCITHATPGSVRHINELIESFKSEFHILG